MSQNFATSGSQRTYGAISDRNVPNVEFSGSQFSPTEMFALCENITTNVYTINSSLKQLDDAFKVLGTAKDNQGIRDKIHVTQLSTNQIIAQTTKDLHRLTVVVRKGDKQQKLQVDKLTSRFKEAVHTYSAKQKQVADKMKMCLLPSEVAAQEDEETASWEKSEEEQTRIAKLKQEHQNLEFEHGMLIEQEQRIKQIEEDILDVNEIMRELGAMVHQQDESINMIESHVENVYSGVESGRQELEKAAEYLNKRRKKTLYLFIIALGILVLLGFIIYLAVR